MTNEEKMQQRKENVRRLFQLEGEDFRKEVLEKHRSEDPTPPADFCEKYGVAKHMLRGRRWYKFCAKTPQAEGRTKKILYTHGGAYVLESGIAEYLFAAFLSEQTGAEIWFPEYHLAPEYTCIDALDMVIDLYRMMLQETPSETISLMGGSAGGGLSLSAAMMIRELGLPQPNSLILYSPAAEMALPETEEDRAYLSVLEQRDPMISYKSMPTIGKLWRGDLPDDDYRGNPIAGDMRNLAPILVFAGTGEVLDLAARHLVKKAEEQGATLRFIEREMMPHCWLFFPEHKAEADHKIVIDTLMG